MGQGMSINQNNYQGIMNNIAQISNEKCINVCADTSSFNFNFVDEKVGNITFDQTCVVSGTSCIMKAAFDTDITNTLTSIQKGSITDVSDPTSFLNDIATMGSNDSISQSNYQQITNNITQEMNSVCQNKSLLTDGNKPLTLNLSGGSIGNLNIKQNNAVNNTQCTISNTAKTVLKNSEYSSQTASIAKISGMAIFMLLILVIPFYFWKKVEDDKIVIANKMWSAKEEMVKVEAKENKFQATRGLAGEAYTDTRPSALPKTRSLIR